MTYAKIEKTIFEFEAGHNSERKIKRQPVAYAEHFHGGFIQWHMVVICIWFVLFVTSQFDVILMFTN